MKCKVASLTVFWTIAVCFVPEVGAQWVQQSIPLHEGWNAVFLEIAPYPRHCDRQFKDMPIRSVWYYNQDFSATQFFEDPNELTPDMPKWYPYFPLDHELTFAKKLYTLQPSRAYLIDASEETTWTIAGTPLRRRQKWTPDGFNLVGFTVDPENPPSFADWFSASPAHFNRLNIWTLTPNEGWKQILDPKAEKISSWTAYWVYCEGTSDYQGPVEVSLPHGTELNYPRGFVEYTVRIRRNTQISGETVVDAIPSVDPPSAVEGDEPVSPLAGPAPLSYYGQETDGDVTEWKYMPFPTGPFAPGPGDKPGISYRVAVERNKMTPTETEDAVYQSVLVVKDSMGFRQIIGVVSEGPNTPAPAAKRALKGSKLLAEEEIVIHPKAGLWVGMVGLNQVSEPALPDEPPRPTPAEFSSRIILHVDAGGTVRMLGEATEMWRKETYLPSPVPGHPEVRIYQPGYALLVTPAAPRALVTEIERGETIETSSMRDGRPFSNRITTPMFSLLDPRGRPIDKILSDTGEFGVGGSTLSTTLYLYDRDQTNPFHHEFHPEHRYPKAGDRITTTPWEIIRTITLEFTDAPPNNLSVPGWGDTQVGGHYEEVLKNLTTDPITVRGTFRLALTSMVPVLNDGME